MIYLSRQACKDRISEVENELSEASRYMDYGEDEGDQDATLNHLLRARWRLDRLLQEFKI